MSGKVLSFFSVKVDTRTLDEIMAKGQKTVIQELEMMAVLAAMKVWKELIKTCRVVLPALSRFGITTTSLQAGTRNTHPIRFISLEVLKNHHKIFTNVQWNVFVSPIQSEHKQTKQWAC